MNQNIAGVLSRSFSIQTVAIVALLFFLTGALIGTHTQTTDSVPDTTSRHTGRIKYTNPLVDQPGTEASNKTYAAAKKQLEKTITEFLREKSVYSLSMYYQDLETGKWFSVNESEHYAPASLMKVTLLLAYYKLAEVKPTLLEETIVNDGRFLNLANVPPAQRLAIDHTYTVDELLYNMIVHSNNEAQHLLSDYLETRVTPDTIARLVRESVTLIPASYEAGDEYDLTVVDYAGIFRILYNATYLSESMSEQALALLAESSYDSGIVNGIPKGIVTANKFGFKDSEKYVDKMQFHDCGIVYAEPNPYILCVMTKTNDPVKAQEAVSRISSEVYNDIVLKGVID